MPKRTKLPPVPNYKGMGKNPEKLTVQKSNPLQSLSETDITLPELKILDTYLARIDSHNPDKRCVQFQKGELENLLKVTWMHKEDLVKRLKSLFKVIEIHDEEEPRKVRCVSLFEEAFCEQDENGIWQVNLTCTSAAMKYIFNIENLGYIRYRLRNVVNLTSRFSYFLYLYIEDNAYRKTWEISVDELKQILNCTARSYLNFKEFNDKILKKGQRDILKNTDLSYDYSTVKAGRRVIAIKFSNIKRIKKTDEISDNKKASLPPMPEQAEKSRQEQNQAPAVSGSNITESPKEPQIKPNKAASSGFHSFDTDFTPEQIECLSLLLDTKLAFSTPKRIDQLLRSIYAKCKECCPDVQKPFEYMFKAVMNTPVEESAKPEEPQKKSETEKYKFVINKF